MSECVYLSRKRKRLFRTIWFVKKNVLECEVVWFYIISHTHPRVLSLSHQNLNTNTHNTLLLFFFLAHYTHIHTLTDKYTHQHARSHSHAHTHAHSNVHAHTQTHTHSHTYSLNHSLTHNCPICQAFDFPTFPHFGI